jgi:hypothetical protein
MLQRGRARLRNVAASLLFGVSLLAGAGAALAQAPADMASEQVLRLGLPYEPPRISAFGDLGAAGFFTFTLIHRGLAPSTPRARWSMHSPRASTPPTSRPSR